MNSIKMKKFKTLLTVMMFILSYAAFTSCNDSGKNNNNHSYQSFSEQDDDVSVTVVDQETDGNQKMNLQALGELARTCNDAASLQEALNKPGSINNIDEDHDGNVDYVKVDEMPSTNPSQKKLVVSTQIKNSDTGIVETQDIATVLVQKNTDNTCTMAVDGNPVMYGQNQNASYQSTFDASDVFLMYWLFSARPVYYSPYYYGHYPSTYRTYTHVTPSSYYQTTNKYITKNTTTTIRRTTVPIKNTATNTNKSSFKNSSTVASNEVQRASTRTISKDNTAKQFQMVDRAKQSNPNATAFSSKSNNSYSSATTSKSPSTSSNQTSTANSWGSSSSSKTGSGSGSSRSSSTSSWGSSSSSKTGSGSGSSHSSSTSSWGSSSKSSSSSGKRK